MGNETIIRADQRGLALGEAFSRRELLYFLVLRDIKIRYKQTTLGIVWAVLVPVVQLIVFTLIFGRVAGLRPDGDYPYPLFLLAGLVPWTFFAQAVTQGSQSLVNQQQMLTKVYFPRLFMPAAAVGGLFVDLLISCLVYVCVLAWFRFLPSWQVVFAPLFLFQTLFAATGAVLLLSAITVVYRDFRYVIPIAVQILMFASPIVYSVSLLPQEYQWLYALNPIVGPIDGLRSAILGKPWNVTAIAISAASSVVLFVIGLAYFRKTERRFADIA